MSARVAVVGANGRVGSAIVEHLSSRYEVEGIGRRSDELTDDLAARAAASADVVVNAAGMAHLERPTALDLDAMLAANVMLPVALARSALDRGIPFVHVSSVKAVVGAGTAYGRSKYDAEVRLEHELAAAFESYGLALIVLRPLALLFPPFDAGKLRWLRLLSRWPKSLTPPIPVPALKPETFLDAVGRCVDDVAVGRRGGFAILEFDASKRATLQDVRKAMLLDRRSRSRGA